MNEEIIVKLGLDQTAMQQGLIKAEQQSISFVKRIEAMGRRQSVISDMGMRESFKGAAWSVGDYAKGLDKAGDSAKGLSLGLGVAGTAFAIFTTGAAAAWHTLKGFMDQAKDTVDIAGTLGVKIGTVMDLRRASEIEGKNPAAAENALFKLTQSAGEAAAGDTAKSGAFKELGVKIEGRTPDEIFRDTADALAAVDDRAKRGRLSADLFSKSWKEVADVMNTFAKMEKGKSGSSENTIDLAVAAKGYYKQKEQIKTYVSEWFRGWKPVKMAAELLSIDPMGVQKREMMEDDKNAPKVAREAAQKEAADKKAEANLKRLAAAQKSFADAQAKSSESRAQFNAMWERGKAEDVIKSGTASEAEKLEAQTKILETTKTIQDIEKKWADERNQKAAKKLEQEQKITDAYWSQVQAYQKLADAEADRSKWSAQDLAGMDVQYRRVGRGRHSRMEAVLPDEIANAMAMAKGSSLSAGEMQAAAKTYEQNVMSARMTVDSERAAKMLNAAGLGGQADQFGKLALGTRNSLVALTSSERDPLKDMRDSAFKSAESLDKLIQKADGKDGGLVVKVRMGK